DVNYPRTLCILTYRQIPKVPKIILFFNLKMKILNVSSYSEPIKIESKRLNDLSKFTTYLFNSIDNRECETDHFSYFISPHYQNAQLNEHLNFYDYTDAIEIELTINNTHHQ